ncbi:MAG: hypothetical protein AAF664_10795 [Planctomycetota bacterium]
MSLQYPIELSFKLLTFGQRIVATGADQQTLMYIKQKMFKLKEAIEVYADESQERLIFRIEADRIIDFSANYHFTDADGSDWGSVRRKGMRSLWSASYEIIQDGQVDMVINEESAAKKLLEGILGEIPILGILAIYLINPSYLVTRPDGTPLLRLTKRPAFFEGKFTLEKLADIPADDELRSLMGLITMCLLERKRG